MSGLISVSNNLLSEADSSGN